MKVPKLRLGLLLIITSSGASSTAAPGLTTDVAVSSAIAPKSPSPIELHFGASQIGRPGGRVSVGVGARASEGKPLEMAVWGGGGAVIGSIAGPLGAMIGGAAGAAACLLYSVIVVPHNGPEPLRP